MVYTIGSGAAPTSAPIGQGAVPSRSSVPIGSGASPSFNFSPPSYNPPRVNTTSSNNHRTRSFHIDMGHHHHHSSHSHGHDDPRVNTTCRVILFFFWMLVSIGGLVAYAFDQST